MTPARFKEITDRYRHLRVAVVGDFCLDRYLEIDPARGEISLETGRPVHNIVKVRAQPGGAGTIVNNLVALGMGEIHAIGFAGEDGEGWELLRALRTPPGVRLEHFFQTPERHTFTYTKPLVIDGNNSPQELNRLDRKNWTPTPTHLSRKLAEAIETLAPQIDALIVLDQVDLAQTGSVTPTLLEAVATIRQSFPSLLIVADSRRSLRDFPPVTFKMNAAELARLTGAGEMIALQEIREQARTLARSNNQHVFVTLAERGILGASPTGEVEHISSLPLRGAIDVVGAGDAVTASLAAALASNATLRESLTLANAAASVVIHQLGTTGQATVSEIENLLVGPAGFEPATKGL